MDSLFSSIISCRELEYIILTLDLKILEISPHAEKFSEFPNEVKVGQDIRVGFPELCGVEDTIASIGQGNSRNFKLKSIAKLPPKSPSLCYVDLYIGSVPAPLDGDRHIIVLLEDTTEQMLVQQKLFQRVNESSLLKTAWSESQAYLDKIINSMADSLLVTNWQGRIKKINPAAQKMFGYPEEELLDRSISILIAKSEQLPVYDGSYQFDRDILFLNSELKCITQSGREIVVSFSCSQLPTNFLGMPDLVYLGKDMTQRVLLETRLRQILQKEKELNEFKSQFVSTLSHRIRTPLNTILLASELLRDIEDDEQDDLLISIQSNIGNLRQIIEDMLLVSQTGNSVLRISEELINITELCDEVVSEIQLGLGNSQRLKFLGNEVIAAKVDLTIFRHILKKIIDSVLKYSSSNLEIQIKSDLAVQEIRLDVLDPSCYLPQEDLERLSIANNISKISGIGLELAIVQKSVEIHGGRIELESDIEAGTVFRVVLPCQCGTIDD